MFSLASLGTIIACVFLLGTFLSVALNVRSTMQQMEQSVGISVFFEPGISTERKDQIGEEIKKKEDIATMRYVSAEEAWESYKKDVFQGNEELLEGFEGNNPLKESDSYEITLKEVKSYKQVVSHLETIDGVRKVRYSEGAAEGMMKINTMGTYLAGGIILILEKRDILTKVGNYKLKTSDALDDIVKKIKGAEGTKVKLTFTRNQTSKTYTFTRQSIENPTVETKMLQDKVGYLQITEFDEVTVSQFRSGLKSLKKQGAKKLIIDLRDNPGGLLTSVVDIAGQILPKGTIVYTEDKNGNKKYYKDTKNEQLDIPLCVLVNGNSASAAEILSGAIKDDKAGTLVGETTFGKGIVQGFFEVGDGSYVKLTYSSYYTPAGHNIHKKGIKPDVEVKDNTKTKADEQLNKVLSILQKK